MVATAHPSSHPMVLTVPLQRRPLMPGIIMPVKVKDEALIKELEDIRARGQAYVGAFLKKEDAPEEETTPKGGLDNDAGGLEALAAVVKGMEDEMEPDPAADLCDVGTFAQVHNIVRTGADNDSSGEGGGGATLLLLGHRRLRRLRTMRRDPLAVQVQHLKDEPHDSSDDVLKVMQCRLTSG